MCGITLTTCSKLIKSDSRLNPNIFQKTLDDIDNDVTLIDKLYQLSFNYKSDINFINFFKSKNERSKIKNFIRNIKKKKLNKFKEKYYEKIKDIQWFLDDELLQRYDFVKNFISVKNSTNHSIVFFKVLHSVINSINLLEIRGRDSLGLFLNITLDKNKENLSILKTIVSKNKYSIKLTKKKIVLNIVYKTFNIIGSLGENSNKILSQFKEDKNILNLFLTGNFEKVTIITHTRWASVGKVNFENTHPIIQTDQKNKIYSFMNGDIQNYEDLNSSKKNSYKSKSYSESDALALCNIFIENKNFNNKLKVKKLLRKIKGSFVGMVFSENIPSEILLIKLGSLGLFKGKNSDRFYFSSDIYGLVEACQETTEFKKDTFSLLDLNSNKMKSSNFYIFSKNNKNFSYKKYEKNVITRRDLVKKKYKFYLEKEIYETPDIVNKTVNNYLNFNYRELKDNIFKEKEFKNVKKIINKIKSKKINKIILVGMGTCHTAAEAISGYMKEKLYKHIDIEISALVSSEASAFHLSPKMNKTLIIAVAQSGTTKDTNIFIEMAKIRGAITMCLLNKRNGDISYLCDSTLYLGNGRDIEISVPSTKTYVAHIVLGYILTNYFLKKVFNLNLEKRKEIKNEIKEIKKIPSLINQTLQNFNKFNKKINYKKFIKAKNWYVVYDNSISYFASSEIRIKLSECCYKTLPCIHINDLNSTKIKNSIIIFIKDSQEYIDKKKIEDISKVNSLMIVIGQKKGLKKLKNFTNSIKILNPNSFEKFNIIPSVINGQLLSFNIAKEINKRSFIFSKILKKNNLNKIKNIKFNDYIFGDINNKKIINFKKNIKELSKTNKKMIPKIVKSLIFFEQFMRRPIDTIKHQAKTITVGTERKLITKSIKKVKNKLIKDKKLNFIISKDKFKKIDFSFSKKYQSIHLNDVNEKDPLINFIYSYLLYLKKNINSLPNIYLNKKTENKNNTLNFININLIKRESSVNKLLISDNYNQNIRLDIKDYNNFLTISGDNFYLKNILNLFESLNSVIFNLIKKRHVKVFLKILNELYSQIYYSIIFYNKNKFLNKINKIKKTIISKNNVKFIGGGINYYINSYISNLVNQNLSKSSSFDVLENHKHIDMSAEPFLFTLISNCPNLAYFSDFISEIEKFVSHNNLPVIITDKYDIKKNKNSNLSKINILNIPETQKEISFIIYLKLFEELYLEK